MARGHPLPAVPACEGLDHAGGRRLSLLLQGLPVPLLGYQQDRFQGDSAPPSKWLLAIGLWKHGVSALALSGEVEVDVPLDGLPPVPSPDPVSEIVPRKGTHCAHSENQRELQFALPHQIPGEDKNWLFGNGHPQIPEDYEEEDGCVAQWLTSCLRSGMQVDPLGPTSSLSAR